MKKETMLKSLWCRQRFHPIIAEDEAIALRLSRVYLRIKELGYTDSIVFDIVEKAEGAVAGEIALRIGEDKSLFYLGHIGYHVDLPYQGRHFARKACRLCRPLLLQLGMDSVIITTDEDNIPSIQTCRRIGCEWECTVDVPMWCIAEFQINARKQRYVWQL